MKTELKLDGSSGIPGGPSGLSILALDPGGTTGWAMAISEQTDDSLTIVFNGGQLGPEQHHEDLYTLMCDLNPKTVVCESFDFRQHKGSGEGKKDKVELVSREYIGVAKLWCSYRGIKYVEQGPSPALGRIRDRELDSLGLFHMGHKVADRHYHDAVRHLLYYMVFNLRIKDIARKWL